MTAAALLASTPEHERATAEAAAAGLATMTELTAISKTAYRSLIEQPGVRRVLPRARRRST